MDIDLNGNKKPLNIHFIGIGGIGMSGIAKILAMRGHNITGSDKTESSITDQLKKLDIKIYNQHQASNLNKNIDLVVLSSAIKKDNPELAYATQNNIKIIYRGKILAELFKNKKTIAITGTHGKTTTTSLIVNNYQEAKQDPSFLVGGILHNQNTNANQGNGDFFITEADESDASFLYLKAHTVIVTNIEADHLENYDGDLIKLKNSFIDFLNKDQAITAIMCIDDKIIAEILPKLKCNVITYGFNNNADYQIIDYSQKETKANFKLKHKNTQTNLELNLAGKHNALNATASFITSIEDNLNSSDIVTSLKNFNGVGRRFQNYGNFITPKGLITLIDDYGHHPSEIKAIIDTIKDGWKNRRLVTIFQPHKYSRTRNLYKDFIEALKLSDKLILTEVYPAGEIPIIGASSKNLFDDLKAQNINVEYSCDFDKLQETLSKTIKDNDIILTLGAGDIGSFAKHLADTQFNIGIFNTREKNK